MNGSVLLILLMFEIDFIVKMIMVNRLLSKVLKYCFFVIVLFVDLRDDGLFVVVVVIVVLLSFIFGFVFGLIFYG